MKITIITNLDVEASDREDALSKVSTHLARTARKIGSEMPNDIEDFDEGDGITGTIKLIVPDDYSGR